MDSQKRFCFSSVLTYNPAPAFQYSEIAPGLRLRCAGGGGVSPLHPPCVTCCRVTVSLRGPGQAPVLPFACSVRSPRSVGRCGLCSCWCRFRIGGAQSLAYWGCAACCGGRFSAFAAHSPPHSGHPPPASLCFCGHVVRQVAVSSRGPGHSPVPPFACCVGSLWLRLVGDSR